MSDFLDWLRGLLEKIKKCTRKPAEAKAMMRNVLWTAYYEQVLRRNAMFLAAGRPPDWSPDAVVFSGASTRSIAFVPVIRRLEEKGWLESMERFAGSSAGSFIAALLAVRYSYDELLDVVNDVDIGQLLHRRRGLGAALGLCYRYGVSAGDHFLDKMEQLLFVKTGVPQLTFDQLYRCRGITLVIPAVDLVRQECVYISYQHEELCHMPISLAIRASCAIPLLFEPVYYDGYVFVDGSIADFLPTHLFDRPVFGDPQAVLGRAAPNSRTLAIRIDPYDDGTVAAPTGLKDVVTATVNTMCIRQTMCQELPQNMCRTLTIVVPNLPATEFNLDAQDKFVLRLCGTMSAFLL
jgi:predicted acylesterase/phospholipase RssA